MTRLLVTLACLLFCAVTTAAEMAPGNTEKISDGTVAVTPDGETLTYETMWWRNRAGRRFSRVTRHYAGPTYYGNTYYPSGYDYYAYVPYYPPVEKTVINEAPVGWKNDYFKTLANRDELAEFRAARAYLEGTSYGYGSGYLSQYAVTGTTVYGTAPVSLQQALAYNGSLDQALLISAQAAGRNLDGLKELLLAAQNGNADAIAQLSRPAIIRALAEGSSTTVQTTVQATSGTAAGPAAPPVEAEANVRMPRIGGEQSFSAASSCVQCHGAKPQGNSFSVLNPSAWTAAQADEVIARVTSDDPDYRMPRGKAALSPTDMAAVVKQASRVKQVARKKGK